MLVGASSDMVYMLGGALNSNHCTNLPYRDLPARLVTTWCAGWASCAHIRSIDRIHCIAIVGIRLHDVLNLTFVLRTSGGSEGRTSSPHSLSFTNRQSYKAKTNN